MQTHLSPILLLALGAGIVTVIVGFRLKPAKVSGRGILAAVLPQILMLLLFYSLAIHIHSSLGKWPESIGERGFPTALLLHANIATTYFSILILVAMFVLPSFILICLFIKAFRSGLYYLGLYVLVCAVCLGAMLLAPSQFLYWWWD